MLRLLVALLALLLLAGLFVLLGALVVQVARGLARLVRLSGQALAAALFGTGAGLVAVAAAAQIPSGRDPGATGLLAGALALLAALALPRAPARRGR